MKKSKLFSALIALALVLAMVPAVALAANMTFTDVKANAWYYDDVKNACDMGLINGKTATQFAPNENLTYAEAVKLAACMHERYTTGAVTLGNGSPWYQTYVDYAKANGIISKNYSWNAAATRAGYMEIFANALPDKALAAVNTVQDGAIPDVSMAHPQAAAIYKLYRAGILQGNDALHSCNPSSNILRSEVAAILTRMMNVDKRLSFTMGDELYIKTQPENAVTEVGKYCTLKVEAAGGTAPYTYQWQYCDINWYDINDSDTYVVNGSVLKVKMLDNGDTPLIRCVVKDANGDTVTSQEVQLYKFRKNALGNDFLMYVEDIFTIKDRGIVVTGRVINGKISVGDKVKIKLGGQSYTWCDVEGIEMFRKPLETAEKGDNIGMLLGAPWGTLADGSYNKAGLAKGDALKGYDSQLLETQGIYMGTLTLNSDAKEISLDSKAQFFYGPTDVTAQFVSLNGADSIKAGETIENVEVNITSRSCLWYEGQKIEVRKDGKTLGTFTVKGFRSN